MFWKRRLYEYPSNILILIEVFDMFEEFIFADRFFEMQKMRSNTDIFTHFELVSHIDLARTIIPHHHDSEMRLLSELLDVISDFLSQRVGQCFYIENHLANHISYEW